MPSIKSLHSVLFESELALDATGTVPTRINILPPPGFVGRDGRGPFVYQFAKLLAAFVANGMPIALDYDHQSENASDKSGPVPASGWITAIEYDEATGVWATVEWTDDAAECIGEKEYRGFSPVFSVDLTTGEILEIIGGGLTNRPNLHLVLLNSREGSYTKDEPSMEHSAMLEKLLAALGLSADTSEADAIATLVNLKSAADKATAIDTAVAAAGITDAVEPAVIVESLNSRSAIATGAYVAKADFEAMSKRASDAETALVAMQKAQAEAELTAVIDAAKTAGKLTPAQVAHARTLGEKDLGALKAMLDVATPVVSTVATAEKAAPVSTHTKKLTAAERQRAFLMGMTDAEYAAKLSSN